MAYLDVAGLSKAYGAVRALDDVGFLMVRGEFLSLLGPSGCGKTTLLRALAGLVTLDRGRIVLDGRDITAVPTHRRDIGFVFQNYALFPHMTVAQNIAFGLEARGSPRAELKTAIQDILEVVGLPTIAERTPAQLSGGQQQRVALARALVTKPRLLLLDEPFGALDRQLRERMQLELRQLTRRLDITAVFVTHDQGEALVLSDRVAVMNGGRIEQVGVPTDVYERPETEFVLHFVGSTNLVTGTVAQAIGDRYTVRSGRNEFSAAGRFNVAVGGQAVYAIRPEKVAVLPETAVVDGNSLTGVIGDVAYLGNVTCCQVEVGLERPFLAHVTNTAAAFRPAEGDTVKLQWPPEAAVLIPRGAR